MEEKNILAYFKTPDEAESAAMKLKALRAVDVSIDRFSKYPSAEPTGYSSLNPITGSFSSLASLTMGVDLTSNSAGILSSADTSASGMSGGGDGGPTGRDVLLTAVVPENVHKQALQVVEEHGGLV